MARKPRIHVPGGFYHVILRGNGGQDIFHEVDDTKYFENLVSEGVRRFGHRVHCYCWMKNHVHLVIQVSSTPLSKIIQNISFRYTLYFNKKYDTIGHLFHGRYKAILIDPQSYLLQVVRYIHLNPVKAKIVNKPEEYRWSSCRPYLGRCRCEWLTTDYVLRLFSKNREEAVADFQEFVADGLENVYEQQLPAGPVHRGILGDTEFIEEVCDVKINTDKKMSMEKIVTTVCNKANLDSGQLASQNRARHISRIRTVIAYLIMEYG
ncbi:MAG: transposase, partial [Candidatus Dadabacteria bacterium]|nr:transposase [Candidatus Dadabacteria bacterium]